MTVGLQPDDEEELLRSVTFRNAQSILVARQRAEEELIRAKEALEARTAELERANQLVRTIAENAASCLFMLDEHGRATYMNPAAVEETGYSLSILSNVPLFEIMHAPASDAGHSASACPLLRAHERQLRLEKITDCFKRADGTIFPVACSLSPIEPEGARAGAVLEFRDITDEQQAQRTLEEANRRKDQFLATLSHELRTPMTAVLGWAGMLKLGLPEEEAREAIETIERSARVQAQLIDDVLDVSRLASGKLTFQPVPVDLAPVIEAALATVRPAAAAKGIEIDTSVPNLPQVLGDEGRLQQIVWNLLSNAVKFTPAGGTFSVRLEQNGPLLHLTVSDSGKGINPEYLPRVFEPFSQEDATTTRSHEGIGLGLSIVRTLVELHGGRIRASSEGSGKGATFTVELPVMESVPASTPAYRPRRRGRAPAEAGATLANLAGVQVLVVDDQALTRDVVAAILSRANAAVRTASSVREGLVLFEEEKPDIVVCDLAMPGEDGFSFVHAVRQSPAASIPVIALTAFGRPEDRQQALAAGFDEYLKKPIDPAELTAALSRLVKP
jgi:PAS domain S-box-containing protein